jgi:quercetin dioxygenase-like cupin family protein
MTMDVRTADVPPTIEHEGTCLSYFMFPKQALRDETEGSYLELVGEFELKPGARLAPHAHNSHEFYYLLRGEAMMQIEDELRRVGPGDLIHIPPNAGHSIWPTDSGEGFRGFAFAVSFEPRGAEPRDVELPELDESAAQA